MRQECTNLFLRYREMAGIAWNVAFWPNADMRDGGCFVAGDYVAAFNEAMARLYEGMVLLPLGYDDRVQDSNYPGSTKAFSIEVESPNVESFYDRNLPGDPFHPWTAIGVRLDPGTYALEFRAFFDWDQRGHRDFHFVVPMIQCMDAKPEAVDITLSYRSPSVRCGHRRSETLAGRSC